MRAFIAIALPLKIKNAVSKIQGKLKILLPKNSPSTLLRADTEQSPLKNFGFDAVECVSWTKPENLHITLKFLGEISPEQIHNIEQIITKIAKTTAGFKIKFETLGVFPNITRPRLIWIGTNQVPLRIKQIVEQLELKLAESGIPKENRLFRNHVTLGRIKNNINPSDLERVLNKVGDDLVNEDFEFDAGGIGLFKSTLGTTGPTYTALDETNFRIT